MSKLIIVSNKLPYEISSDNGEIGITDKKGGVTTSLNTLFNNLNCSWVGWTGNENIQLNKEEEEVISQLYEKKNCYPIQLDEDEIHNHHYGFCNQTIWPLFHYFAQYSEFNSDYWEGYKKVNRKFADKVIEIAGKDDKIWIHDYHLMLLPEMIREVNPELSIGFFLHIPFPSFEIFRILPWRREIVEGILGADLVAFHSYDYERHYMSCVRRLLGHDSILNTVKIHDRVIKIDNFPMGIDFDNIQKEASGYLLGNKKSRTKGFGHLFGYPGEKKIGKILLSIDRLDYAKGLPVRLEAFEEFLIANPEYLEKVSLVLFVIPSREIVAEYHNQRRLIDELVGRINGEFGTMNWMPIFYYYRPVCRDEMIELYTLSDVALITPLRDGMNLMAKEYMASRTDGTGVMILSEMAGAAKEMSEAIIVNPNNKPEIVEAIRLGLTMPVEEQQKRNNLIRKRLKIYNEQKWATDIFNSLENVKKLQEVNLTKKISKSIIENFQNRYSESSKRVIFLDYDGTLTGFHKDPQEARPDEELYRILNTLISDKKNTIVIISGRDKETLGSWFEDFRKITFIAEHGVWVRKPGNRWSMIEQIDKDWMEIIRPIITFYVDRTPRSLLEEKNYSLVWHYRDADPDLGIIRAWELKDELRDLVPNLNLEIMDGDKVIEIKNSGINKGRAAAKLLEKEEYDFIMALGDDWTDEYTFGYMPDEAITIKVGTKTTKAGFYIDSVESVRSLLQELGEKSITVR